MNRPLMSNKRQVRQARKVYRYKLDYWAQITRLSKFKAYLKRTHVGVELERGRER